MSHSGRFSVLVLALAWTLFFGGSGEASAQIGQNCSARIVNSAGNPISDQISMFLVPDGSGTPFTDCYKFPGTPISVEISVTIRDASGPLSGVSADRIRLAEAAPPPTVAWCNDAFYPPPAHAPNVADMPTDGMGKTKFTMAYHGGGWAWFPTYVWVLEPSGTWVRISGFPLDLSYNSADINGDFIINLVDLSLFASDYFGSYAYRSDFMWDGVLNLGDVGIFASAMEASCP